MSTPDTARPPATPDPSPAAALRISYPPELPVSARRDEIAEAIATHQVVIVAGETGSGKTTQIPKICLELGRGTAGMIGHTQPRRIAARAVAERLAEELGQELGQAVGYQVRFTARTAHDTRVKVMTDGILLAELSHDPQLRAYDTVIVDEAHERSLNIDVILGYLKRLLPHRPDLKVVITSATIDHERFAAHFGNAPVIEVSGRTYPVEVRYRPLVPDPPEDGSGPGPATEDEEDEGWEDGSPAPAGPPRDQDTAICEAVDELAAAGPGDVLVFLPTEREIRDAADALGHHIARSPAALRRHGIAATELLPLFGRLSAAEQHRVFSSHPATTRRIVLSTNVAETSLTVPGIRYVVDAGTARISRYSHRTKVQRLPVEPVSQASANQRAGRCGRVAEGICIRLYSERDFASRPEYTDPEILRTNLASVVLRMADLRLGPVDEFPFLDPPEPRAVRDGLALLRELGAIRPAAKGGGDTGPRLTRTGRALARIPVDPRLGRMVLAADHEGSLAEVLVIASALAVQDPRERPADRREAADAAHRRFRDETSDFLSVLNLWRHLATEAEARSGSQFRKMCRAEFLHYLRVREWQDMHRQLAQFARRLGLHENSAAASPDAVHRALLAGLLSHIGMKEPEPDHAGDRRGKDAHGKEGRNGRRRMAEYRGARGTKFAIFPGSGLARKQPDWVMAAELVETSRLWGRTVATVTPEWAEALAGDLAKRSYSEPHWSKHRGSAVASEKVTLFGVPIVSGRTVAYGRIDPESSRELFIRHALVEGDWETRHEFFHANRRLLRDVEDLEHRARRHDILADDEDLFAFYDERVPAEVVSAAHFDSWWKRARRATPDLLDFSRAQLISNRDVAPSREDFPDSWRQGDLRLRLTYRFDPDSAEDGVTVHIPVELLNRVDPAGFDWQVPGLREDLATALVKSLPKPVRRGFVPAPDTARAALALLAEDDGAGPEPPDRPFTDALAEALTRLRDAPLPAGSWQWDRVPAHLRMTFRVEDARGKRLREGKDLARLKAELTGQVRRELDRRLEGALEDAAPAEELERTGPDQTGLERTGLTSWSVGTVPRTVERRGRGRARGATVRGYPALVDAGAQVSLQVLDTSDSQARAMHDGVRRLLLLGLGRPAATVRRLLDGTVALALARNPDGTLADLIDDCLVCALDGLMAEHAPAGGVWDEAAFDALREAVRPELIDRALAAVQLSARICAKSLAVEKQIDRLSSLVLLPNLADAKAGLAGLLPRGFAARAGEARLPDLLRYLRALEYRVQKLPENPQRDRAAMAEVAEAEAAVAALRDRLGRRRPGLPEPEPVRELDWMVEELRVSLFAVQIGTRHPVSVKRIRRAVDETESSVTDM